MGSNVVRGEVEGTIEFTGSNTFFGKTASMLQGSDELGNLQKVLLRIMIILVILSFALSGIVFGYLLYADTKLEEAISFTVVLIVASIPIAIEIVCTTTLALGSKELSKHGAIVTRLAAIEDMAGNNINI
jgi:H+-transporting ATPase